MKRWILNLAFLTDVTTLHKHINEQHLDNFLCCKIIIESTKSTLNWEILIIIVNLQN